MTENLLARVRLALSLGEGTAAIAARFVGPDHSPEDVYFALVAARIIDPAPPAVTEGADAVFDAWVAS